MAGTAADVARVLKGEVGYQEGRSGGHWNNKQKYSGAVPGLEWSDYQAWCQTFTTWTFQTAGMPKGSYPVTASCALAVAWWKKAGRWSEYPAIGAPVFFGPGGGSHTGIVIAYGADTITTVEGNTNTSGSAEGDGVYRKVRQRRDSYVYGYGYPEYPGGIKSADPTWKNPAPTQSEEDDVAGPIDVLRYRNKAADAASVKKTGKHIPDVYGYIVQTHTATLANAAAIKALAKLAGAEVDTAAVVAAVEAAIADAVIKVDVDINQGA